MPGARPEQRPPDPETSIVDVDGQVHAVRFRGFGEELEVVAPVAARLAPWTVSAHLAALDRDVQARGTGCRLDAQAFCAAVLAGVPEQHHPALQSLALWWASCGGEAPVAEGDAVRCGPVRVRLRPWTLFERSRALSAALRRRGGGAARAFHPGRYLGEMARASIVEVDPGLPLGELPGAVPLLCAVVDRNLPRPEDDPGDDPGDGHLVEVTLRLCQALGWTPERVWSTPAVEVDRLLRLLDAAGRAPTAPRVTAARPRLADDPDATVIRVEED